MARSIDGIYDAIIKEKESRASLSGLAPSGETSSNLLEDLTSDSKVAVWRLWAYITAVTIHSLELLFDLFKVDIEELVLMSVCGTPAWYQAQTLLYQHGDDLIYNGNQYVYDPVEPANQIISRAAIEERPDGVVLIKVAKGAEGALMPLDNDEKLGLQSYIDKIKFAGTRIAIFTSIADELTLAYDLHYDPIVPLPELRTAIFLAGEKHLGELGFNGILNITNFTDMLQTVEGVIDPVFISGSALAGGVTSAITLDHVPASGYYKYKMPLDQLINFIPKI